MTEDLDLDLGAAASAYDIPDGDVDAVMRRAAQRDGRRKQGLAIASIVGLVAASAGVLQLREDGSAGQVAAGTSGESTKVTWRRVDVRSGVGQGFIGTGRPLYALSTSAAERDLSKARVNKTVWQSDDGVEWSTVSTLSDDLYLTDLSKRDSRIYAVGTAPGTASAGGRQVSNFVLGWSDDGAKSWQRSHLPIDTAAIAAASSYVNDVPPKIVSSAKGTVAVVTVLAELDVPKLLPDGTSAPNGWSVTSSGVDILGPRPENPCPDGMTSAPAGAEEKMRMMKDQAHRNNTGVWCFRADGTSVTLKPQDVYGVTRTFRFEELGLRGDALDAARRQPFVFAAPPGSTDFTRHELPAELAGADWVVLDGDDTGFRIATGTLLATSADGKAWRVSNRVASPQTWTVAVGTLRSTTAMLTSNEQGGAMLRDDGNGGWVSTSMADVLGPDEVGDRDVHLVSGGIGEFGAVAVVALFPKKEHQSVESRDAIDFRVLTTRDGVSWDAQRLTELAGGNVLGVLRVHVTADDATVIASVFEGAKPVNPRQVALVAAAG